jgi:hypothetical protein
MKSSLKSLAIAFPFLLLALAASASIGLETPAKAAKKYSCNTCPIRGIDSRASTPLGTAVKESGCRVRKGVADLPVQDPECTPGAINQTVTAGIIKSGRFRTGCVRNCITTEFQKGITYDRYGIQKARATCELDHLVPLELGGADSLDNIWPQCGPVGADGQKIYFKEKDLVEDYLTALVRAGKMELRVAQEPRPGGRRVH